MPGRINLDGRLRHLSGVWLEQVRGIASSKIKAQRSKPSLNLKFVSAGKAMFEAGNPGGTGQLSSCFVLPVQDNIQSIFKTLGDAAVVHKNNGGTGLNFYQIRPPGG